MAFMLTAGLLAALHLVVVSGTTKCCGVFGCFTDDPPFSHMPLPDCPDDIDVSQVMYTRSNSNHGQVITTTTIPPVYNSSKRTVWVTHGWIQGGEVGWLEDMKNAFLTVADYNVIMVGWQDSSQQLWYPTSASSTRTVGAVIAMTAQLLMDREAASPDSLWCIGHSLGSHVCGHAGQRAHFGRVTGLDPAGPFFESVDESVGVNPKSADFVDIHHTNGEGSLGVLNLGTMRPLGHVDFYPNGGGRQPGCILDPIYYDFNLTREQALISPTVDLKPVCSHLRTMHYFIESLTNTQCKFYTRQVCADVADMPGSCTFCGEECQVMGWDADQYTGRGKLYLETNSDQPYCLG